MTAMALVIAESTVPRRHHESEDELTHEQQRDQWDAPNHLDIGSRHDPESGQC